MKDLTEQLATQFALSDAERHELLPSGQQTLFSNRVAWAKSHLKYAGLIDNPVRGKVLISDAGKLLLSQNPPIINCKLLRDFPSYLKFIGAVPSENQPLEQLAGLTMRPWRIPRLHLS